MTTKQSERKKWPAPSHDMIAAQRKPGKEILAWFPKFKLNDDGDLTSEVVGGAWGITSWQGGSWNEPKFLSATGQWFGDEHEFGGDPTHWLPMPPDVPIDAIRAALTKSGAA